MRTGSTITGTDTTIWTRTWCSVQSGQFKIIINAINQWEGAGDPRVSNTEGVRHPQPQHVPRLQRAELIYANRGTIKDLDL